MSRLLQSLVELTTAHAISRKRLVCIDFASGHELLQSLARTTGGWVGWEAVTPASIAVELAFVPLEERGERKASDVEVAVLVNEALDRVVSAKMVTEAFAELTEGAGYRGALRRALLEARAGALTPQALREAAEGNQSAIALAAVLEQYEELLVDRKLVDSAGLLQVALDSFDQEAPFVLDGITVLTPSLSMHGLQGALLDRLRSFGAIIADSDAPVGRSAPVYLLAAHHTPSPNEPSSILASLAEHDAANSIGPTADASLVTADVFAATTPAEELREVCRRVLAEGLRWDDVEIASTDTATYGVALDALCSRLGVGVTMTNGLPMGRTRIGRALDRWFTWIGNGLPADVLRHALEAGDIELAGSGVSPARLAREMRGFRIGWGVSRYRAAIDRITTGESVADMMPFDDDDDAFEERRAHRRTAHEALAALLGQVLASLPPVPERGADTTVRSSVHDLAKAALAYLALVQDRGPAEAQTRQQLEARLLELASAIHPATDFRSALAALREALDDLTAWPLLTNANKPWASAGAMLHLTSLKHAGCAGRKRVFVVGLDAERTRGGVLQDPVLSDAVRIRLTAGRLLTVELRRERDMWRTEAALAALRGRVTLSYAMQSSDESVAGPSPLLLQVWRTINGQPASGFKEMRVELNPASCAVPSPNGPGGPLDARDVWLSAMVDGALTLRGDAQIREAFPSLAAGLTARDSLLATEFSEYQGRVPEAGSALDPLAQPDRQVSPSSLETLGSCALAWFYRYGLGLRAPDDPEYDVSQWLDAMQRGLLLHGVFEQFVTEYLDRPDAIIEPEAASRMTKLVEQTLLAYREVAPPPSEMLFASEAASLQRDALTFLEMEREQRIKYPGDRWMKLELPFGTQHDGSAAAAPGTFEVADGRMLSLKGRADRVDMLADGSLRVVDYKTGSSKRYLPAQSKAAFGGGRHLQPALYAAAVESITGDKVSAFEYRFPTEKGSSEIVRYEAAQLASARSVVSELIHLVSTGNFIATDDHNDCTYCDYKTICRASTEDFRPVSPRANWSAQPGVSTLAHASMRARRGSASPDSVSASEQT